MFQSSPLCHIVIPNQERMLRIKREWNAERIEERDSDLRVLDEDSWLMIGKSIDDRSEYDNIWMK